VLSGLRTYLAVAGRRFHAVVAVLLVAGRLTSGRGLDQAVAAVLLLQGCGRCGSHDLLGGLVPDANPLLLDGRLLLEALRVRPPVAALPGVRVVHLVGAADGLDALLQVVQQVRGGLAAVAAVLASRGAGHTEIQGRMGVVVLVVLVDFQPVVGVVLVQTSIVVVDDHRRGVAALAVDDRLGEALGHMAALAHQVLVLRPRLQFVQEAGPLGHLAARRVLGGHRRRRRQLRHIRLVQHLRDLLLVEEQGRDFREGAARGIRLLRQVQYAEGYQIIILVSFSI